MRYRSPGQHRSVAAFREHLQSIDPALDCVVDLTPTELAPSELHLAQPIDVAGRRVGNRFATHPMEGWDGTPDGLPTERTMRRWRHFGASGAKLIWGGEAFAVQADGRANPHQLFHNPAVETEAGLTRLRDELLAGHRDSGQQTDDLLIGLQLTHSGRFARPDGAPAPKIAARHPLLESKYPASAVDPLSDGELEDIGERYVAAARLAARVGFDFVDVKCCHGYLLHELLGAKTRPGPYGGSLANRMRLFERIVESIRTECPGLGVGVRVSIADTVPFAPDPETRIGRPVELPNAGREEAHHYGFGIGADGTSFDWAEPFEFLRRLRDLDVRLINLSLGSPYANPHLQRPAAYPPSDGYLPPCDPLASVAEHLRAARRCKAEFGDMVFVGTGYTYLQEFLPHVAEYEIAGSHVDLVGIGRMLLSYPELPRDLIHGHDLQHKRICRTLSDCTTAPRNGLPSGCYPLDPYYKRTPEAAELRSLKQDSTGSR